MAWELLAIWAIIVATFVWYVRDERRLARQKLQQDAVRFATLPAWRHKPRDPDAMAAPLPSPGPAGGLSPSQRKFFEEMTRAAARGQAPAML